MSTTTPEYKMDADLKAKWVAALRSDDYEQARGRLRTTSGEYCCLGVLCDITAPAKWHKEADGTWHFGDDDSWSSPPTDLLPTLKANSLIDLNDDDGKTFPEIADWIEANL